MVITLDLSCGWNPEARIVNAGLALFPLEANTCLRSLSSEGRSELCEKSFSFSSTKLRSSKMGSKIVCSWVKD